MIRGMIVASILVLCSSSGSLLWAQGAKPAGFEQALESARSYPIQWNTPGHCEHAVALFEQVIAAYPHHPRIAEAKYGLFTVLAISDNEKYLTRAHGIINEVIQGTDAATPLGCSARLSMVAFQVNKARHHGFEDLPAASAALGELEKVWGERTVERANIVEHQAMLLRREGRNEQALVALISYFRESYTWPGEYWVRMKNDAPEQYSAFRLAFMQLNNQAVQAIAASNGPETSRLLRSAPLGFLSQPLVVAAWKEYEEQYILGEGETFETIRERVYRDAIGKMNTQVTGSHPITVSPGGVSQQTRPSSRPTSDNGTQRQDEVLLGRTSMAVMWWVVGTMLVMSGAIVAMVIRWRGVSRSRKPNAR